MMALTQLETDSVFYNDISRMRGGALIQPIAMEVCTSVWVTSFINDVNFRGCSLRGLVSAKGRI
jgi:hypothetical protein